MIPRRAALVALATLGLAGCMVGPDYSAPLPVVGEAWIGSVNTGEVDGEWWRALGDPILTGLVETALKNNMDIDEVSARVREARANRDAVRGRALGQAGAGASAVETRTSSNGALPVSNIPGFEPEFPLLDLGFDASWEIDLWGANRRAVEGAEARIASVEEVRRGVRLQVIAEVVRAYIDLRAAQNMRESALVDATAQQDVARVVEDRFRTGSASRFDVTRARAQARTTAAAIPGFEADAAAATYRLALLLGRAPETMESIRIAAAQLPVGRPDPSIGLRSDLLRRRPDIRRAERELAAATADVGVATADLFPRLSLVGGLGQQARSSGDLLANDSLRFQIGPTLRWPVFSGGRIRAQIRAADARTDAAAIRYERAVLAALADSETSINRLAAASRTRAEREAVKAEAAEALGLARRRYLAGEDDLTALLQAQSAFSAAERGDVQARASELQQLAALYKALGGGWEALERSV